MHYWNQYWQSQDNTCLPKPLMHNNGQLLLGPKKFVYMNNYNDCAYSLSETTMVNHANLYLNGPSELAVRERRSISKSSKALFT